MSRLTKRNESICDYCEYERNNGCIKTDPAKCVFSRTWNELQHYKDLEEQGRLVELPCKVGDTVYGVDLDFMYIDSFKVLEIFITEDGIQFGNEYEGCCCKAEQFGTQVFLTKEEAEAKLEELKGGAK